jgi:hypothetical protein
MSGVFVCSRVEVRASRISKYCALENGILPTYNEPESALPKKGKKVTGYSQQKVPIDLSLPISKITFKKSGKSKQVACKGKYPLGTSAFELFSLYKVYMPAYVWQFWFTIQKM